MTLASNKYFQRTVIVRVPMIPSVQINYQSPCEILFRPPFPTMVALYLSYVYNVCRWLYPEPRWLTGSGMIQDTQNTTLESHLMMSSLIGKAQSCVSATNSPMSKE